ncbi:hypothetical protein [Pseudomonas sp. MWU13-2105]|nr:hypothetical protein [Pseudomonas sp. MWU13-2105]
MTDRFKSTLGQGEKPPGKISAQVSIETPLLTRIKQGIAFFQRIAAP